MNTPDQPHQFQNREAWRAWLQENHAARKEAWIVILKNHAPKNGIYYEEAVEEALCFGWIDGVMKSTPEAFYYLRFSPRKQNSTWSASNQKRVAQLIEQGRMTEAGLAKIREARENGEWDAAIRREDPSNLPDDLQKALAANAGAQANFEQYPASQKKQILYWIASAKMAKTRRARIQSVVEMAAQKKRFGER